MQRLPLFLDVSTPIEREPSVSVSRGCTRCGFASITKNPRCAPADAQPGGLLVVGGGPSRVEAAGGGRPFSDQNGATIRGIVGRVWSGPVGYDYAIRCDVGFLKNHKPSQVMGAINGCRGHLAAVVRAVKPQRIIVTSTVAAFAILGRNVQPLQARKAYAYLSDGTPVFFVLTPQIAGGNRFMRAMAEDDFRWAATAAPEPPAWGGVAYVLETLEQTTAAADFLRAEWLRGRPVAWDVETAGRMWTAGFRLTALGLTPAGSDDAHVLTREACADPLVRAPIAALLADRTVGKGGANVKYDVNAIENAWGVETLGTMFDTRLWRKLAEPDMPANLAVMAELIGYGGHKEEAQAAEDAITKRVNARLGWENQSFTNLGNLKKEPPTLAELGLDPALEKLARSDESPKSYLFGVIDRDVLHRYNARDCVTTGKLALMYRKRLHGTPQGRVWDQVVRRANDAMTKVERWGIGVSLERIHAFDTLCSRKSAEHREIFAGEAPGVDPSKNEDVKKWLYQTLGLPVIATTAKSGEPSTDKHTLDKLSRYAPAVETLLWIRKYEKLQSTYAAGMLPHVRDDGRIHPSFLLDGAETGRTSCVGPNLQNIPRAKHKNKEWEKFLKMARSVFCAPKGRALVQLDYSQVELRVAVMLSKDPIMRAIFDEGVDFHRRTAELIAPIAWGIQPHEVGDAHRTDAKSVNFGILFGKTARTFAREFNISLAKAQAILDAILGTFLRLRDWSAEQRMAVERDGGVWTYWNGERARFRPLWKIGGPDDAKRSTAINSAVNTPIQGSASEFCISSIADMVEWIERTGYDAKVVLPVHDSVMLECRIEDVDEVIQIGRGFMVNQPSEGMPLVVDAETGPEWGALKKYTGPVLA